MANEVTAIPTTVDYTSRDYYAIRQDLITRIQSRIPTWQGSDPNDFGVALVESFAYLGDILSYYIDRVANEMSLETATRRNSIINLASMFGYTPSGYQSATCTLTVQNTSATEIVLPVGTQFRGSYDSGDVSVPVVFEAAEEVTVAASGSSNVTATHGESIALRYTAENGIAGEIIGASDGSANQTFILSENKVVEGSVRIYVLRNGVYEEWSEIANLIDAGPTDTVFSLRVDATNTVSITFGDGISGKIPTNLTTIKAQYVVGGGSEGRVPANIGFTLYAIPGVSDISAVSSALRVLNDAGVGGSNPESTTSIRKNAPYALSSLRRAVSLEDYANITLYSTEVGKASANSTSFTSVNVYVAPAAEDSAQDPFPGYDPLSYRANFLTSTIGSSLIQLSWDAVEAAASGQLFGKTQVGVTATVLPPTYVPVVIRIVYTLTDAGVAAEAVAAIKSVLDEKYGYNKSDFGLTIYPEEIEANLRSVPNIESINVTQLYRLGDGEHGRKTLVSKPGEIFRILSSSEDTTITGAATDSTPTSISGLTLSPSFAAGTTSYEASTTSGAKTLTIEGSNHVRITYNDIAQELTSSTGTILASITAVSGTKDLVITCVAEDGVTETAYTIAVTV